MNHYYQYINHIVAIYGNQYDNQPDNIDSIIVNIW